MKRTEVSLGWKSIPGYRHQMEGRENEDAVLVSTDHPLFDALMIVADGMGGHEEPKRAAETAAGAARDYLTRPGLVERYGETGQAREFLRQAVRYANQRVMALSEAGSGGVRQPGSTLTVAAIADGELHVVHAGDGSTMLLRDGRLRALVGGEERRLGSRPEEYLGRGPQLAIEEATEKLTPGDRILICTDGLTRYFGPVMVGGGSGLGEILGRAAADPQAIANQLTAHSRTDQYDDDTSVVVAEVVGVRRLSNAEGGMRNAEYRRGRAYSAFRLPHSAFRIGIALISVAVMIAAGFALVRWRPLDREAARPGVSVSEHTEGTALRSLPREDLLLMDLSGKRFYVLRSRPTPPPSDPVELEAMRTGPDGRLQRAGRYRWDPEKGILKELGSKRSWAVDYDAAEGTLRPPGVIAVTTVPAGAACTIDGKAVGKTPLERRWRAGVAQVSVRWASGAEQSQEVTVLPGRVVPLSLRAGS